MKHKTLTILLMVLMSMKAICASAFKVDGIYYKITSSTNLTVEVVYDYSYRGSVIIPSTVTYNGINYSVTAIDREAFEDCGLLTSVTIPHSVTSIGYSAFDGCSALESIVVESGNTVYDSRNNCNAIIETASNTLIVGCKNTLIPNSVTSIGSSAFSDCSGLTSVTISNSVTSISSGAFSGCSGIESIVVESGNTVYDSRNNCNAIIETASNTLIVGCKNTRIPNTVTSIGSYAFRGSGLTILGFPDGVTSIGSYAFSECYSLEQIFLPNTLISIRNGAFSDCHLISITIPESVKEIGSNAFYECFYIKSVKFASIESLCSISFPDKYSNPLCYGAELFISNYGLDRYPVKDLNIPSGVATIGKYQFFGCSSINSVTIPNSVTEIGTFAFSECTGLTTVTIPKSVTSIGSNAFYRCTSLKSVYAANPNPISIEEFTFHNKTSSGILNEIDATLHVPVGSKVKYRASEGWKRFYYMQELEWGYAVGDVNNDEVVDITDVTALVNQILGKE